ncbi:MAG: carotenoid oxygenase family protein [Kofleriaceae bacterium]
MVAHAVAKPAANLTQSLWTQNLTREHGFEPLEIEGTLPGELRGTVFRNGPGQFEQFGRRYSHPFEADGAVTAVRFEGGKALGASKLTATAGLADERAAGKMLYGFSVPWLTRITNGLRGRSKNTANTSVVMWQGRLFALMEAGKPTELDPRDLATLGETDLDGVITSFFSAHPHRVASRKAIYNFGIEYGRATKLHLYELPDVGAARELAAIPLAGPPMLHDFIATDTHLVVFLSPVRVVVPRMLLQVGSMRDMFAWRPEQGTEVICVPIDRPGEVVRFTTAAFYQWHFANAFDRGTEIVVDYVRYPTFDTFHQIGAVGQGELAEPLAEGRAHRAVIDLRARTLRSEPIHDTACEFPIVAAGREGREHTVTYAAMDNLRGIARYDAAGTLVRHDVPDTQRASEPVFVPRGTAEDDGWLVSLCHDGPSNRAFFAVYDARRIPDGPIARAWFDHQVPITFHGTFTGTV